MTDDELLNPFEENAPTPFAADDVLDPFVNDTDLLNPFTATGTTTDTDLLNPFTEPGPDDLLNPLSATDTDSSPFDDPGEHQLIDL
jgi:hypothetical protein